MRRAMLVAALVLAGCTAPVEVDGGVDAGPIFAWEAHASFTAIEGPAPGRGCPIADGGTRTVSRYEVDLDAGQMTFGACLVLSGNVEGVRVLTQEESSALVDALNALTVSSATSPSVADKSPLQLRAGDRIFGDAESLEPHDPGVVFVQLKSLAE